MKTLTTLSINFFDSGEETLSVVDANGLTIVLTDDNIFGCESLVYPVTGDVKVQTYVDGEDFAVTEIGNEAFKNNLLVEKVTIPATIKIVYSAFTNCVNLKSVVIEDGVEEIYGSFANCESLKSIAIPKSVKFPTKLNPVQGCISLEEIIVDADNELFDSRDNCNAIIETATNTLFAGCKNTIIPQGVTAIKSQSFEGITGLKEIVLPTSITEIADLAFYECKDLTSITIPDSVTSIGTCAFEGTSLKNLTIPASVTNLGKSCFQGMEEDLIVIFEGTTPATMNTTFNHDFLIIYVPDEAVEAYKTSWKAYANQIKPVSEYVEA